MFKFKFNLLEFFSADDGESSAVTIIRLLVWVLVCVILCGLINVSFGWAFG